MKSKTASLFFTLLLTSTYAPMVLSDDQTLDTKGTEEFYTKGPLRISGSNQYFCIERDGGSTASTSNHDTIFSGSNRLHFYYNEMTEPSIVPPSRDNFVFCHDTTKYGLSDSVAYPRLGLAKNSFYVWGLKDRRFYDFNDNDKLDINDEISAVLAKKYNIQAEANIFFTLFWKNGPVTNSTSGSPRLGYIMQSWIDSNDNDYCLTQKHYNSDSPLFKILKDYVGIDTEALYVAASEPETIVDPITGRESSATNDYLLIKESDIKKIWFYYQDGEAIEPDQETVQTKTLHFYWPVNKESNPYVKTGSQKIYTVKSLSEVTGSSTTVVEAQDKRIGCVPKTNSEWALK